MDSELKQRESSWPIGSVISGQTRTSHYIRGWAFSGSPRRGLSVQLCQAFRKSTSSDVLDFGKTDLKPITYSHLNSPDVPRSRCGRPFGTYGHPCWVFSPAGRNRHWTFRKLLLVPAFSVWQSSRFRRLDHRPGIFVKGPAFPFGRNFRLVAFAGKFWCLVEERRFPKTALRGEKQDLDPPGVEGRTRLLLSFDCPPQNCFAGSGQLTCYEPFGVTRERIPRSGNPLSPKLFHY